MIIKRVDVDRVGQRIDNALIYWFKQLPRSLIYRWVRKGQLRVNGKRVKVHYRLELHDEIRVPSFFSNEKPKALVLDQQKINDFCSRVLFADDDCLVINKPAGIPVQKGSKDAYGIIDYCKASGLSEELFLVHRLDKQTTGCLVLAKNRLAALDLGRQFKKRQVKKTYQAIVMGEVKWSERIVDAPLLKLQEIQKACVVVDDRGKSSKSSFRCLSVGVGASLVEVDIETGRTHQIRVHSKYLGCPVWGDERYTTKLEYRDMQSNVSRLVMCLHAVSVSFDLISSGSTVNLKASISEEFKKCLQELKILR